MSVEERLSMFHFRCFDFSGTLWPSIVHELSPTALTKDTPLHTKCTLFQKVKPVQHCVICFPDFKRQSMTILSTLEMACSGCILLLLIRSVLYLLFLYHKFHKTLQLASQQINGRNISSSLNIFNVLTIHKKQLISTILKIQFACT